MTMGLRRGEVLALKWSDINWHENTVTVQRSGNFITGKGMVEKTTKTVSSRRTLVLFAIAHEALERQRTTVKTMKRTAGPAWKEHDYVFPTKNGTMTTSHSLDTRF